MIEQQLLSLACVMPRYQCLYKRETHMNITLNSLQILSLALSCLFVSTTGAAPLIKTIDYAKNEKNFEGLLVSPEKSKSKRPLIVLVHNWMGVTDETKKQATRFAELGYQVFAADIYGKGVRPKDAKEAGEQATLYKTDRALFREHLNLALRTALLQKNVDPTKIAVLGYCFGGTGAIELARSGADLKAIISFHGGLDSPTPSDGKNIKGKLLALQGADDPYVPAKDIAAFENEMTTHGINYKLIKYPGAVHSFTDVGAGTDNSKGAAYNEAADKQSFAEAKEFLAKVFKPN
jgi:dienelactone hydrolase